MLEVEGQQIARFGRRAEGKPRRETRWRRSGRGLCNARGGRTDDDRFVAGNSTNQDWLAQAASTAADGQFPKAIVLSCLDSRVPVEIAFDQGIGDVFVGRVAGNFEANSDEAIFDAILAGQGIALQPLWLVGRDLKAGRLEEVLTGYHAPDSSGYLVYPPGRHLSPKVRRFIDHLVAGLAREEFWNDETSSGAMT